MDTETNRKVQELMSAGDFDGAISLLEGWTRKDPGNWQAFTCLGAACAQVRRFDTAVIAFRRAVQLKPRAANLRYNLGRAYDLSGNLIQALHEYECAMRIDPAYTRASDAYNNIRERLRAHLA